MFKILYEDDDLVAIDKPEGFQVHPPEDKRHTLSHSKNVLYLLRNQTGKYLYPIHRLDSPASGILLFAYSSKVAGLMQKQLQEQTQSKEGLLSKKYAAVVRGVVPPLGGVLDRPLKRESGGDVLAVTHVKSIAWVDLKGTEGAPSRSTYSWVVARPLTGAYHQIRRHLAHASHPLIGDAQHGDLKHNRFFRDELGLQKLFLRCFYFQFTHPLSGAAIHLKVGLNKKWNGMLQKISWNFYDQKDLFF